MLKTSLTICKTQLTAELQLKIIFVDSLFNKSNLFFPQTLYLYLKSYESSKHYFNLRHIVSGPCRYNLSCWILMQTAKVST